VTELYGFARFTSARGLMAFLGLVRASTPPPTAAGKGDYEGRQRSRQRVCVEASWHYRHRPSVLSLKKRREGQAGARHRDRRQSHAAPASPIHAHGAKGIPSNKIAVAVARELTGFLWAALQEVA